MAEDMSKYMDAYIAETEEHLQNLNDSLLVLEKKPTDKEAINQIFRSAHTLKSSSATMSFQKISELAHAMEDVLGRIKNKEIRASGKIVDTLFKCFDKLEVMIGKATKSGKEKGNIKPLLKELKAIMKIKKQNIEEEAEDKSEDGGEEEIFEGAIEGSELAEKPHTLKTVKSVRVSMERLDKLMNLVGELLINKMRLQQIRQEKDIKELNETINHLDRLTTDLQFEVMQSRLVPVEQIFNRFPRMVRDLAKKEDKDVNFIVEGNEIELDRTVIDEIGEPLVHLLRNSVDHGVELPAERKAAGKKAQGTIRLTARRERNAAIIEVEDDGRGFDVEEIKKAAVKKGIMSSNDIDMLSPNKVMQIAFDPRFSTAKKVTEVSGRGVGLDVVKNKIEALNGNIGLETVTGKGTKFSLELPLTLAIIQCFLVRVEDDHYVIPLANVLRTVKVESDQIRSIEGYETFILDEEDIPLIRLTRIFGLNDKNREDYVTVMVEKGGDKAALVVDEIVGKQELIIKPLDRSLRETRGFSGCTILGDGSVALILDLNTLL